VVGPRTAARYAGQSSLSLFRTSTPPITGRAQYPYSLQAVKGTPNRIAWLGAGCWPEKCGRGKELGNNIQFSFSCKARLRFPVSVDFCFPAHTDPDRKERDPIISYLIFPPFFITAETIEREKLSYQDIVSTSSSSSTFSSSG
jgi:hypothetical protein